MRRELPTTILLVTSGLITGFFGARYYFFPQAVLPATATAQNFIDAAIKGTAIMHISALMLVTSHFFWKRRELGYQMAWFIAVMINSFGLMIFMKTGSVFVLTLDLIRGALLLLSLYVYSRGRSAGTAPATSALSPLGAR